MMSQASFILLALSAARVQAQEFTNIDLYSAEGCNPDPNDLEIHSFQLGFHPEKDEKGNDYSGCMAATIDPTGWPSNKNGKYDVWVDTDGFGDGCSMLFFQLPGSQEEGQIWPCRNGLYRQVQKNKTPCGDLELTKKFGYAYCCGSICNKDVSQWPSKRSLDGGSPEPAIENIIKPKRAPASKDITKVKRAPIFNKRQKNENCIINLKSEPFTTYGQQIRMGPEETCEPDQTTCGQQYTYTVGNEITNSQSGSDTTEIGFAEYLVFSNTIQKGWEISESKSTERSRSKNIGPEPGHSGYPTFTPLYICAEADLSGDCSREKLGLGDGVVCINKYTEGDIPDGDWKMVTTD
ncbi:hypothetical protein F53441_9234 [Fusarium austroafricanum]|uniref:Uncharacterized protein n=1 Tax=Fusarium austroafricanum TaxID=2364996 RepID=A0A8H4K9H9_9HYPO|nr:hypothetical protein F53441_9234 [Fusarium austroafricanum]